MITVIIVLGISDATVAVKRVNRAVEFFQQEPLTPNRYLLFSGGSAVGRPSVALRMSKMALSIPDKNCIGEEQSKTTVENLVLSKKIITEHFGVNNVRIVVCTSSYHINRAMLLAKNILPEFTCEFIHTNEKVTPEQFHRESRLMWVFASELLKVETSFHQR